MTLWHAVIAVLINLLWGSMFIAAVIGLREFPPILFTGIRFGLLAVLLLVFCGGATADGAAFQDRTGDGCRYVSDAVSFCCPGG